MMAEGFGESDHIALSRRMFSVFSRIYAELWIGIFTEKLDAKRNGSGIYHFIYQIDRGCRPADTPPLLDKTYIGRTQRGSGYDLTNGLS